VSNSRMEGHHDYPAREPASAGTGAGNPARLEADRRSPRISARLIRRMGAENPRWGAPRIHGELLKLGFVVAQSSVAKYMVKRCGPPSDSLPRLPTSCR
jgi:hypothetical protein